MTREERLEKARTYREIAALNRANAEEATGALKVQLTAAVMQWEELAEVFEDAAQWLAHVASQAK